jgi:drug/metabolite transporter (DMT)-like permease
MLTGMALGITITKSVGCALGSMFFAGVNDLVFKKQAMSGLGRGQYLSVAGVVWTLVFCFLALAEGGTNITRPALQWGLIAGTFSIAGNYLLVCSLRHLDASIGATIYRLNLILVAIIAIVGLNESLTLPKIIGLSLAGVAVVLFAGKSSGSPADSGLKTRAFIFAIIASILRAGMGISYKLAALDFHALPAGDRIIQNYWFIAIQGLIWFIVGLLISIHFEGVIRVKFHNVRYGILSGGLICGIVLLMAKAVATGDASVAIPITQMSFLVTSIISWPLTRERFLATKIVALGLATAAVLFLTIQ